MPLPPLYKFLDVHGARLTLENRTFRHAIPSDFNDTEDLTIQSIFPDEIEVALETLVRGLPRVILKNLDRPPTYNSPLRALVVKIQQLFRAHPDAVDLIEAKLIKSGTEGVYNIEHMRVRSQMFIQEINEFMQGYRVLCVTAKLDSEPMWMRYAEQGNGVALRITPNLEKNSKFLLFHQVSYADTRPSLYDDTLQFVEDALFVDRRETMPAMLDKIIYTKTREWEYENEYRLAIPLRTDEPHWDTQPYHREEISELYIGPNTTKSNAEELIALAYRINPEIEIFQMLYEPNGVLTYCEWKNR